jgi:SAM-dependent methyltransferase
LTRRADPGITDALWLHLGGRPTDRYLDVGCGTGNYTGALAARGGVWTGIDVSETALQKARRAHPGVVWRSASADDIPFQDDAFDGAIAILCIHHFPDLERPFREIRRVLQAGRFVIFIAFAEQMRHCWLAHYFPDMLEKAARAMPSEQSLTDALARAGFATLRTYPFSVTKHLEDLFLYSGKQRPRLYLDPNVRANISSFSTQCTASELARGLEDLAADLERGTFSEIAALVTASLWSPTWKHRHDERHGSRVLRNHRRT